MPHIPLGASARFKGKSRRGLYGDAGEELDGSDRIGRGARFFDPGPKRPGMDML